MASQGFHVGWRASNLPRSQQPAAARTCGSQAYRPHKTTIACKAQQQHIGSSSDGSSSSSSSNGSSSSSTVLRPIEVSRHIAAARAAENSRTNALFADPYAAALSGQQQQQQHQQQILLDVIATRYIDECLLNAMSATNVNSIQSGDYRQVVLLGDGMDCRPFRLPWPPGTLLFMVAPAEVHEQAEAQLAAAAAAAAAAAVDDDDDDDDDGDGMSVPAAHVQRGCLLRRVNMNWAAAAAEVAAAGGETAAAPGSGSGNGSSSSSSSSTIFMQELQKAGFRADRLSVWAIQGLHNQGISQDQLRQLLTEVTNLAAFHSLLVGELPGPMSKRGVDNMLAEAGLLGAVVTYDREDISYGRWQEAQQSGVLACQQGLGSSSDGCGGCEASATAAVGDDVIQDRWLVTGQQLRLSLEQMGIYEDWSAEFVENDIGDDYIGNFS